MLALNWFLAGPLSTSFRSVTSQSDSFRDKCLKFQPNIQNAKLEFTEFLQHGTQTFLTYRDLSCGGPGLSPVLSQDVCRVALYITTSDRSGIHFEAWLPKDWSGRFLSTGNGGIGGCLDYSGLVYTTQHGFAAVASNNGHNGTSGRSFINNPDVVEDFAGRSMHTNAVIGKEVTELFYHKPHAKSYFLGCSQGGRQGIGAAEKFPGDFDGIVAGAPALDFNNLISWRASFYPITGSSSDPSFIKPELWSGLIHDEVLRQCDGLDGVKDGIIEHPDLCEFDPKAIECHGDSTARCLTTMQVDQVRKIFSPLTYEDGTIIYPAMQTGSEMKAIDRLYAGKPFSDSQDWFRNVIYSNPSWQPLDFRAEKDAKASEALNPFNIQTFPSHLQHFQSSGGKIIMYHGMQDQQITSFITSKWYDHLLKSAHVSELDHFIRYFRISGMFHCGGGPGAWMIGQGSASLPFDREHNVLAAIVDWVEHGIAPETIEGTKYSDDVLTLGVSFTRKHCRYPKRNILKSGKVAVDNGKSKAADWECV